VNDELEDAASEPSAAGGDSALEFRAVTSNGKRRGIKLERVFWDALRSISKEKGLTIGGFVDQVAATTGAKNLTSAIRVACMNAYVERNDALYALGAPETVEAVLTATPTPAFTLASNRRIVAFNTGFQALVRRQFVGVGNDSGKMDLRLSLDVAVDELLARLTQNRNSPVSTGFILSMGERRHRGQVNVIRVPSRAADLLMAFVSA
jgi:predicted DNA-binding ribbon-helix-helix protein